MFIYKWRGNIDFVHFILFWIFLEILSILNCIRTKNVKRNRKKWEAKKKKRKNKVNMRNMILNNCGDNSLWGWHIIYELQTFSWNRLWVVWLVEILMYFDNFVWCKENESFFFFLIIFIFRFVRIIFVFVFFFFSSNQKHVIKAKMNWIDDRTRQT